MTVKSDDVVGRVKVYEALVKGKIVNQAGVPESFRVLLKEFQALGLDIQILNQNDELVDIQDLEKDEEDEDGVSINEIDQTLIEDTPSEPETYDEDDEFEDDEFEDDLDSIEFPGENIDIEEEDGEEL